MTNIVLVANAVVWYAGILIVLENNLGTVGQQTWLSTNIQLFIWGLHFAALIFSAIIGAKISGKISERFSYLWIALNIFSSLTLFGLGFTNFIVTTGLVILFGVSFGLGMPMCMSKYSDSVPIENRGRASGIIMLVSGIGIFGLAAAPLNLLEVGIILSIWRLSGLFVF